MNKFESDKVILEAQEKERWRENPDRWFYNADVRARMIPRITNSILNDPAWQHDNEVGGKPISFGTIMCLTANVERQKADEAQSHQAYHRWIRRCPCKRLGTTEVTTRMRDATMHGDIATVQEQGARYIQRETGHVATVLHPNPTAHEWPRSRDEKKVGTEHTVGRKYEPIQNKKKERGLDELLPMEDTKQTLGSETGAQQDGRSGS